MTTDTIIIGGGLSGLYAGSLLQERKERFLIFEGRKQLGGRIRNHYHENKYPLDVGPSWFWPETNPRLSALLEKYKIEHFAQDTTGDALVEEGGSLSRQPHREVDPRNPRRVTGSSMKIVRALAGYILPGSVRVRWRAIALREHADHVVVNVETVDGNDSYSARNVIIALPPRLAATSLRFTPELPAEVLTALQATPTWMAGDAKFFALYDEPFWRNEGLSGSAFCDSGPLSEAHDVSLPDGPAALTGFLIPDHKERVRLGDDLVPACLEQLGRLFGPAAASPRGTFLQDWSTEALLATEDDVPLAEHPEYGLPDICQSQFGGRLHFAGTEVDPENGGYMEGALAAAERIVEKITGA